jgi:hypothetical protein
MARASASQMFGMAERTVVATVMRALVTITKTARDFHDMPGRRDVSAATIATRMDAQCEGKEHPGDNKKRSHLKMPLKIAGGGIGAPCAAFG